MAEKITLKPGDIVTETRYLDQLGGPVCDTTFGVVSTLSQNGLHVLEVGRVDGKSGRKTLSLSFDSTNFNLPTENRNGVLYFDPEFKSQIGFDSFATRISFIDNEDIIPVEFHARVSQKRAEVHVQKCSRVRI